MQKKSFSQFSLYLFAWMLFASLSVSAAVVSVGSPFSISVGIGSTIESFRFGQAASANFAPYPPAFSGVSGSKIYFSDKDASGLGPDYAYLGTDIKTMAADNKWVLVNGDATGVLFFTVVSGEIPEMTIAWLTNGKTLTTQSLMNGSRLVLNQGMEYTILQKAAADVQVSDLATNPNTDTEAYVAQNQMATFSVTGTTSPAAVTTNVKLYGGNLTYSFNGSPVSADWAITLKDVNGNKVNASASSANLPLTLTAIPKTAAAVSESAGNLEVECMVGTEKKIYKVYVINRLKPFNVTDCVIESNNGAKATSSTANGYTDAYGKKIVSGVSITGVRLQGNRDFEKTATDAQGGKLSFDGLNLVYTPAPGKYGESIFEYQAFYSTGNLLEKGVVYVSAKRSFDAVDESLVSMNGSVLTIAPKLVKAGTAVEISGGIITGVSMTQDGKYGTNATGTCGKIAIKNGIATFTPSLVKNAYVEGTDTFYYAAAMDQATKTVTDVAKIMVSVKLDFEVEDLGTITATNDTPTTAIYGRAHSASAPEASFDAFITGVRLAGSGAPFKTSLKGAYGSVKITKGMINYAPDAKTLQDGTVEHFEYLASPDAKNTKIAGIGAISFANTKTIKALPIGADTPLDANDDTPTEPQAGRLANMGGYADNGWITGVALEGATRYSPSVKGKYGTLKVDSKTGMVVYTPLASAPDNVTETFTYQTGAAKGSKILDNSTITYLVRKSFGCGDIGGENVYAVDTKPLELYPILLAKDSTGTLTSEPLRNGSGVVIAGYASGVSNSAAGSFKTSMKFVHGAVKITNGLIVYTPNATAADGASEVFYYQAQKDKKSKVASSAKATIIIHKSFESKELSVKVLDDTIATESANAASTAYDPASPAGTDLSVTAQITGFRVAGSTAAFKGTFTGEFGKLSLKNGMMIYTPNSLILSKNEAFQAGEILYEPGLEYATVRAKGEKTVQSAPLTIAIQKDFTANPVVVYAWWPAKARESMVLPLNELDLFSSASGAEADGTLKGVGTGMTALKFGPSCTSMMGTAVKLLKSEVTCTLNAPEDYPSFYDEFAYSAVKQGSKLEARAPVSVEFRMPSEDLYPWWPDYIFNEELAEPATVKFESVDGLLTKSFVNVTRGVSSADFAEVMPEDGFLPGERIKITGAETALWIIPDYGLPKAVTVSTTQATVEQEGATAWIRVPGGFAFDNAQGYEIRCSADGGSTWDAVTVTCPFDVYVDGSTGKKTINANPEKLNVSEFFDMLSDENVIFRVSGFNPYSKENEGLSVPYVDFSL